MIIAVIRSSVPLFPSHIHHLADTVTRKRLGWVALSLCGLALACAMMLPLAGCSNAPQSPDRPELIALYNATDGRNWVDNDKWNSNAPLEEWQGVVTDDDGRVTALRLSDNGLKSTIPGELGNLTYLTLLDLSDNNFPGLPVSGANLLTGEIPPELGNLSNLEHLYLHGNNLSGEIPPELGNLGNLEKLFLGDNNLRWGIPPELGSLSNLKSLDLIRNNLSEEIPSALGNLGNLEELLLGSNNLSGEIPPELGNLRRLRTLWLPDNNLTGTVPAELGNLAALQQLGIQSNHLEGPIPSELGNLTNLREAYLGTLCYNPFTGEQFDKCNRFTGCVPMNFLRAGYGNDSTDLPICLW